MSQFNNRSMGLFDIFSEIKQNSGKNDFPWISLNDVTPLDEIQQTNDKTTVIFKHSSRCGISSSVLSRFEKKYQDKVDRIEFYLLDLLNYRAVSSEIAERFQITHQSPQIIVLENGKVKTHASHYDILEITIN
ncbi:MAG: bacillithiol system redox-active protein YtxJ [Flavobacteriaceae bacterium]|nr:bacillithiol system redox-active protein YtxJ [Flavobacteriaceae bacterium]